MLHCSKIIAVFTLSTKTYLFFQHESYKKGKVYTSPQFKKETIKTIFYRKKISVSYGNLSQLIFYSIVQI